MQVSSSPWFVTLVAGLVPGLTDLGFGAPRAITVEEIKKYVQLLHVVAHNAVHRAGFDGDECILARTQYCLHALTTTHRS